MLTDEVKAAVLIGSLIAAVLAATSAEATQRQVPRACTADEERDEDLDGIPDVYEEDDPAYHLRMAEIHERRAADTAGLPGRADGPAATARET